MKSMFKSAGSWTRILKCNYLFIVYLQILTPCFYISESTRKGWEILGVISITFPPSKNLESYLFQFVKHHHSITQNQLNILSLYVFEKLTAICSKGARGKVLTATEIERAMEAPFKPSVFGESLDTIMNLQKEQEPALKIPKLVIFLSNAVHDLNGFTTEGIFRVPGDIDAVTELVKYSISYGLSLYSPLSFT